MFRITIWLIAAIFAIAPAVAQYRSFPPGMFQSRAALDASSGGGGYTGPGDIVSYSAWYGWQGYSASYSSGGGKVANVCNPTDAACVDFVLGSDGKVIVTTVGGLDCSVVICTVKTLYDQTGAKLCTGSTDCNITQATIANRPILLVNCQNSLPCMTTVRASSQQVISSNFPGLAQPYTTSYTAKRTAVTGSYSNAFGITNSQSGFDTTSGNLMIFSNGTIPTFAATEGSLHTVLNTFNNAASEIYLDGSASGALSLGNTTAAGTGIGVPYANGGNPCTCTWMTGGVSSGAMSSGNKSSVNSNQHTFWNF